MITQKSELSSALFLAWSQLKKNRGRFATAIAGIAFANILMLMQLGFKGALFTSATTLPSHLDADIFLIHPRYQYSFGTLNFPRGRLQQARSIDSVEKTGALMFGTGDWRNPATGRMDQIFVIGMTLDDPVFDIPELNARIDLLKRPDMALFDELSRPKYGPVPAMVAIDGSVRTELNHRDLRVGGTFALGTTFVSHGNLVMGDHTFLRLFPWRKQHAIDVGIIKLKPGSDVSATRDAIDAMLEEDVAVLDRDAFLRRESDFWDANSPISYIFTLGVVVGFVVGIVIVYQILYADVSDHLAEYATLKAMGYADSFLSAVVSWEGTILSVCGYLPGLIVSAALYRLTAAATLLPMNLELTRAAGVFVASSGMCLMAGALALRKLRGADPAEIF